MTNPYNAIVNPFRFFQLDMQGGIFHSSRSSAVSFRGGECITGAGGEGGPTKSNVNICYLCNSGYNGEVSPSVQSFPHFTVGCARANIFDLRCDQTNFHR